MTDTKQLRIDDVGIKWLKDYDADLSWLGRTLDDYEGTQAEKEAQLAEDRIRIANYGNDWVMLGCVAEATVSYSIGGQGDRRLETLVSGGLWNIESDSSREYLAEIERGELSDLKNHLAVFGIDVTNFDSIPVERVFSSDCASWLNESRFKEAN